MNNHCLRTILKLVSAFLSLNVAFVGYVSAASGLCLCKVFLLIAKSEAY